MASRPNILYIMSDDHAANAISCYGKWHLHCVPESFDDYKYLSGHDEQGTYQGPEFMEKGSGVVRHNGYVTDITRSG